MILYIKNIFHKIKLFIKVYFLPYRKLNQGKEIWEKQFDAGHWNYLGDIKQLARYSILVGFVDYFFSENCNILDLGCGNGVLLKRLKNIKFSSYTGVDLASKAIEEAARIVDERSNFICESIEDFQPNKKYDIIIFNESLYYLDDPIKTLFKFNNYLSSNGKIIISMWDSKERNNKLWKLIEKKFNVIDEIHLQKTKTKSAWIIKIISTKL